MSSLELTDRLDGMNNKLYVPKKEMELEGAKTRLAYLIPAERSPLEVLRNYEDVVKAAGGQILFSCKATVAAATRTDQARAAAATPAS